MTPINKLDPTLQNYYPTYTDRKLHDDFRKLFDHVYALQSRLGAMEKEKAQPAEKAKPEPQGPSNTKINGLYVQAVPPNDGDRLTYDAKSGQVIWKP